MVAKKYKNRWPPYDPDPPKSWENGKLIPTGTLLLSTNLVSIAERLITGKEDDGGSERK